ncbi:MAG: hypothetical protein H3C50_12150, partial [Kiritimatiellae bacterium]|nr:hypothetical protein [Kiritimatiellia bacterium]
ITFTISMLTIRQPDVQEHGRLFSYAIIILLNTLGLGCWIVAVAHPTLHDYTTLLLNESLHTWTWLQAAWAASMPPLRALLILTRMGRIHAAISLPPLFSEYGRHPCRPPTQSGSTSSSACRLLAIYLNGSISDFPTEAR